MTYVVLPETEKWAKLIRASWGRGAEAIIETGRLLINCKNNIEHGQWQVYVEKLAPFSLRTIQRLMEIARDPKLSKATNLSFLPPHCSALHELTYLDDMEFEAFKADGTIHPDMEARDIAQRRKGKARDAKEQKLGQAQCALPQQRFGVIVADPEWQFTPWSHKTGMDRAAANHYPTSSLEVIMSRPVENLAAKDCALFLWATIPMLPHALLVMAAWGFDYKSHYCWGKDKQGTGYWNFEQHELLLIGTRGSIPCPSPGAQRPSLVSAPRKRHSEKPEVFLEMIEQWFPTLPKIELNRRGPARKGWSAWGNEAEADDNVVPLNAATA